MTDEREPMPYLEYQFGQRIEVVVGDGPPWEQVLAELWFRLRLTEGADRDKRVMCRIPLYHEDQRKAVAAQFRALADQMDPREEPRG